MKKQLIFSALVCFLVLGGGFASYAETASVSRGRAADSGTDRAKIQNKKNSSENQKKAERKAENNAPQKKAMSSGKNGLEMRVGLLSAQTFSLTGLADYKAQVNGKTVASYKNGKNLSVSRKGDAVYLDGKKMGKEVILTTGREGAAFAAKGNRYRGDMKIFPSRWGSGVTLVNVVPMEDYLRGVVPKEVISSWHTEAIKAQAVAARTYAAFHKGGYESSGYDVTDDTRSQVYGGISAETPSTDRAIRETEGEILTYKGKPIDAVFHSSSGGYTENSENIWGTSIPYLRGVKEVQNGTPWTKTIPLDAFAKNLYGEGTLKTIQLSRLNIGKAHHSSDRGISGRVKSVKLGGSKGNKTVTGAQIQKLYGLSSTLFDIAVKGKNVVITGYGAGHGLGLSQWGAEAFAEQYKNKKGCYKDILAHYFTGAKLEKEY